LDRKLLLLLINQPTPLKTSIYKGIKGDRILDFPLKGGAIGFERLFTK